MLGSCYNCCIPDDFIQPTVTWYGSQPNAVIRKEISPPPTIKKQITQTYQAVQNTKETKQTPQIQTTVSTPRTVKKQVVSSAPTIGNVVIIRSEQRLKDQRIRFLQNQNREYVCIINNELIPLRRDYDNLRHQYQNKLKLVQMMDLKLQEIQRNCYPNYSKASMGSHITMIP